MKTLRQMLILAFATIAIAATAQESDPVIASIQDAYKQAKVMMKQNEGMGNELVTKANYTVRGKGKTTETFHFFYNTVEGTYLMDDDGDPHFFYYPLYFVTRSYNIGKQKYYEEFLFDPSSQRLLFALVQDYDENGKRIDRRFYYHEGNLYKVVGPTSTSLINSQVYYWSEEVRHAFDWIMRNPKE